MLAAGTLLDNRYSIDHQIGAGGFADVYQAWDHRLKRRVAVKVMLLNRLLSDQERELIRQGVDSHRRQQMLYERQQEFLLQFRQEAELVAGLDHPNILAVNDNGTINGEPYLVMPLIEGGSLRKQVPRGEMLSIALSWPFSPSVVYFGHSGLWTG